MCDGFLFYIDTDSEYTITFYYDKDFVNEIISKTLENQKIAIPDKSWITSKTKFIEYITPTYLEESPFNKLISQKTNCAYKEKYVYKYNVTKEYYDNNYYEEVDGYIKDETDYKIYYKGTSIINNVEIIKEKIIKIPQIEYIYLEKENKNEDSSGNMNCNNEPETIIKTKKEIVEKEIYKIPKKLYIIIIILILTMIILVLKIAKNVKRNN